MHVSLSRIWVGPTGPGTGRTASATTTATTGTEIRTRGGPSSSSEPQANRTRYRDPLRGARGCQPTSVRVAREHDNGVGPLIGDEQPPSGRIQAEIARPMALCGDRLVERERASRFSDGKYGDTVVAAVRHVQGPAVCCDVDVGRVIRAGPPGRDRGAC